MVNGKQKGSAFERQVCVKLSRWVSAGKDDDLFWRSAMSGGRATVSAKNGKKLNNQAGDICAVGPAGHALTSKHYIECKFYRDLSLESFFLMGKGKLATFWLETVRQAKAHDKAPILIAKQNRSPDIMLTAFAGIYALVELSDTVIDKRSIVTHGSLCAEVCLLKDVLSVPFMARPLKT